MNRDELRALILEILQEQRGAGGVRKALPETVVMTEQDRLDTGTARQSMELRRGDTAPGFAALKGRGIGGRHYRHVRGAEE